jgi:ferric iron reductase protein FhuF
MDAAYSRGMFFALENPTQDQQGWCPVSTLYTVAAGPLDALLEYVRLAKGGCELRVAASIFFQGFAARLLSPPLACIAMKNCLPDMPSDRLCWRQPECGMLSLGMSARQGWEGSAELLIAQLIAASFDEHLLPLRHALLSRVKLAEAVLTDNVASALIGGLELMCDHLGQSWTELAATALTQPHLSGCGRFPDPGRFVRRSCCLVYRVPPGEKCGDCPINLKS